MDFQSSESSNCSSSTSTCRPSNRQSPANLPSQSSSKLRRAILVVGIAAILVLFLVASNFSVSTLPNTKFVHRLEAQDVNSELDEDEAALRSGTPSFFNVSHANQSDVFITGSMMAQYIENNLFRSSSTPSPTRLYSWIANTCLKSSTVRCDILQAVGGGLPELDKLLNHNLRNSTNRRYYCCALAAKGKWTKPFAPGALDVLTKTPVAAETLLQRVLDPPLFDKLFSPTNGDSRPPRGRSTIGESNSGQLLLEEIFRSVGKKFLKGKIPIEQARMMSWLGLSRMKKVSMNVISKAHYVLAARKFKREDEEEQQQQQKQQQRSTTTLKPNPKHKRKEDGDDGDEDDDDDDDGGEDDASNDQGRGERHRESSTSATDRQSLPRREPRPPLPLPTKKQKAVRIFTYGLSHVRALISNFAATMRGQDRYFDRGCHTAMRYTVTNYGDYLWFSNRAAPDNDDLDSPVFPDFVQVDRDDEVVFFEITYVYRPPLPIPATASFTASMERDANSSGRVWSEPNSSTADYADSDRRNGDNDEDEGDDGLTASEEKLGEPRLYYKSKKHFQSAFPPNLNSFLPPPLPDPVKRWGGASFSGILARNLQIREIFRYQQPQQAADAFRDYSRFQFLNHFNCDVLTRDEDKDNDEEEVDDDNNEPPCLLAIMQTPIAQYLHDMKPLGKNSSTAIYERFAKQSLGEIRDALKFCSSTNSNSLSLNSTTRLVQTLVPSWLRENERFMLLCNKTSSSDYNSNNRTTRPSNKEENASSVSDVSRRSSKRILAPRARHIYIPAPRRKEEPFRLEDYIRHSQCIAHPSFPAPTTKVFGGEFAWDVNVTAPPCHDAVSRTAWFKFALGAFLTDKRRGLSTHTKNKGTT